jgi:hypothetical protein
VISRNICKNKNILLVEFMKSKLELDSMRKKHDIAMEYTKLIITAIIAKIIAYFGYVSRKIVQQNMVRPHCRNSKFT